MGEQGVVSTAELAKMLGVSRVAVFKKIKRGELEAVKIGRSYAISRASVPSLSTQTSKQKKRLIEKAVKKTVSEYGDALRRLGNE